MAKVKKTGHSYSCPACRDLASGPLASFVHPGKQAVRSKDKQAIDGQFDCSLSVDALAKSVQKAGEKIFDYLLIAKDACAKHLVEVHGAASAGEVEYVIAKKKGTQAVFGRRRIDLSTAKWHWAATPGSKPAFKSNDKYGKQLVEAKISQPMRPVTI